MQKPFGFVVFDLFHTVVDDDEFRPKTFKRAREVAGLFSIDVDAFSKYWSEALSERVSNRIRVVDQLENYLRSQGIPFDSALLSEADALLGRYQDLALLRPRPEIESVLRELSNRGIGLGLLSNCDEREVREWPRSPLSKYFHSTCFSFETGYAKPSADAYVSILRKLKAIPDETIYVGDGGSNELVGAKKAGFGLTVFAEHFVKHNGLCTPSELEEFKRQADLTITRFDQLLTDHRLVWQ